MRAVILSLLFSLLFPGLAMAERQEFQTLSGSFSVDVPRGWQAQSNSYGCVITDNGGEGSVNISFLPLIGQDPVKLAERMAQSLGITVTERANQNGIATVSGTVNGVQAMTAVGASADTAMVIVMLGKAWEDMYGIYGSIRR